MKTVIVSENPLFGEVIREMAREFLRDEFVELRLEAGADQFNTLNPDLIILDECLPKEIKDNLLSLGCHLSKCRMLIVNLLNNDFVMVNSKKSTIRKVKDLRMAMAFGPKVQVTGCSSASAVRKTNPVMAGGEDDLMKRIKPRGKPKMRKLRLRPKVRTKKIRSRKKLLGG